MIIYKGDKIFVKKKPSAVHFIKQGTTAEVISKRGDGYLEVRGISTTHGMEILQTLAPGDYDTKDRELADKSGYTKQNSDDSQKRKLLKLLANGGTIDRKQALMEMHIFNITARISELRALGIKITMRWKRDHAGVEHVTYYMTEQGLRQAVKDHLVVKRQGTYVPLAV